MSKSRKPWLDIIRATAILCVVLCHSVEAFYRPVLLGQLRLSFPFWNIENLLFTVGRIGVPLFLATTGALMLPRDYPDVSAFYKKSLFPLFLTTEICTPFYFPVITGIFKPQTVLITVCSWYHNLFYDSDSKCFFQGSDHRHSWFQSTA